MKRKMYINKHGDNGVPSRIMEQILSPEPI